jgi:multidrug resistance efflux pump
VLDAIFDAVDEKAEIHTLGSGSSPFRATALANIDVPVQVDNLLPLTSRRTWLALIGVAAVIIAFLAYAAGTTQTTSIQATGRAVAATGVAQAASPGPMSVTEVLVAEGQHVGAGDVIARGAASDASPLEVRSPVAGSVWQLLVVQGGIADLGTVVATVLPDGSDMSVLVSLDEAQGAQAGNAERIDLKVDGAPTGTATMETVQSAPVPAQVASARTSTALESEAPQTLISLAPDHPITAGSEVSVTFVLSERTLLQAMFGLQ